LNDQAGDIQAPRIRIIGTDEIAAALHNAGLRPDRAVIVLVGGADGMGEKDFETVAQVLRDEVVPVAERRNAVVIDGGTDAAELEPNHTLFLLVPGTQWGTRHGGWRTSPGSSRAAGPRSPC
jgi:hypothetical protein